MTVCLCLCVCVRVWCLTACVCVCVGVTGLLMPLSTLLLSVDFASKCAQAVVATNGNLGFCTAETGNQTEDQLCCSGPCSHGLVKLAVRAQCHVHARLVSANMTRGSDFIRKSDGFFGPTKKHQGLIWPVLLSFS